MLLTPSAKFSINRRCPWGDPETLDRVFAALGFALSLVGQRWVGPSPRPEWRPAQAGGVGPFSAVTQRAAVALHPQPDTHFRAAPAPTPPPASSA